MIPQITRCAAKLNISEAGLLKLARDIAKNRNLPNIQALAEPEKLELFLFLKYISERETAPRLFLCA